MLVVMVFMELLTVADERSRLSNLITVFLGDLNTAEPFECALSPVYSHVENEEKHNDLDDSFARDVYHGQRTSLHLYKIIESWPSCSTTWTIGTFDVLTELKLFCDILHSLAPRVTKRCDEYMVEDTFVNLYLDSLLLKTYFINHDFSGFVKLGLEMRGMLHKILDIIEEERTAVFRILAEGYSVSTFKMDRRDPVYRMTQFGNCKLMSQQSDLIVFPVLFHCLLQVKTFAAEVAQKVVPAQLERTKGKRKLSVVPS
ncbi:hypothetical protein BC941DRAFT_475305 [Chlamydoabsidia padenii]|nr:hypothetical protein BC941DRAFT_475305 [Chlamydoabsidia padenii]